MDRVKAVIINEGITMHRVIFYMAFVVEGRDRLVLAFKVQSQSADGVPSPLPHPPLHSLPEKK
jgi:hypothetical protein